MYPEITLMNLIATATGYTVKYAEDSAIDLLGTTGTVVYVGHLGIKLQYPEQLWANGYNELENPEILYTTIQYVCNRTDWHTVRANIAAAYQGFTPFPNDSDYSSMVFVEANVIAKSNTRIWAQEITGLIFPRIS